MKSKTIKVLTKCVVPIIVAFIGLIASAFGGAIFQQIRTQNYIKDVMGNNITIDGDDNDIVINDIESLTQNYLKLTSDYESLKQQKDSFAEQSVKYFDDLTDANNTIDELNVGYNKEIEELKKQLDSAPVIDYKNLALCIDIYDIPINSKNSMVTIDGRDYFSREIVENIIPEDKNMTIKNDTMFIGQVVAEKDNLFKQTVFEQNGINKIDTVTDSYNNNYSDVLCTDTSYSYGSLYTNYITYNLDAQYSQLMFSIAIRQNADPNSTGILTVKADDEVVYTSRTLDKKIKAFTTPEIPIHNCDLLRIEYTPNNRYIDCILSNAIIYN